MKINNGKFSKKKFITLALAVILLIALAYSAFAYAKSLWPFEGDNYSSAPVGKQDVDKETESNTEDTSENNTESKADTGNPTVDANELSTEDQSEKTPEAVAPSDNSASSQNDGPTVSITAIQDTGSQTRISTLIEAITNSGSCTLKFVKGSSVITQTAGIQASASASTCKGFTIENSRLSSGTWEARVTVTLDGKSSTATKTYEVK